MVQLSAAIVMLGIWILLIPVTTTISRVGWLHVLLGAVMALLGVWALLSL